MGISAIERLVERLRGMEFTPEEGMRLIRVVRSRVRYPAIPELKRCPCSNKTCSCKDKPIKDRDPGDESRFTKAEWDALESFMESGDYRG